MSGWCAGAEVSEQNSIRNRRAQCQTAQGRLSRYTPLQAVQFKRICDLTASYSSVLIWLETYENIYCSITDI